MYKIDFNVPLLDLDKKPVDDASIGKLIAQIIVTEAKGDSIKLYGWGILLHEGKTLELDESDWQTLNELLKNSERITHLVKAPALQIMLDAKLPTSKSSTKTK